MIRLVLALASLLIFAGVAQADQLSPRQTMQMAAARVYNPNTVNVIGNGGHAFGPLITNATYAPAGIDFYGPNGSSLNTHIQRASALLAPGGGTISNGPKGIISFWVRGTGDFNGSQTTSPYVLRNTDLLTHGSNWTAANGQSSETTLGVDLVFDSSYSNTNNEALRLNMSDAVGLGSSFYGPLMGVDIGNIFGASDFGNWVHFLIAWDATGGGASPNFNSCLAVYKNNVNVSQTTEPVSSNYTGSFPIQLDYANAAGFAFGYNPANAAGPPNASYGETYVDFNPPNSPCQSYNTNATVNPDGVAGAYISPALRAKFVTGSGSGNVTPINLGASCATPSGSSPTMCFRGNGAAFPVNQGYGGAFVATSVVYSNTFASSSTPVGQNTPTGAPVLKWKYPQYGGTTSPTALSYGSYSTAVGDLILIVDQRIWSSAISGAANAAINTPTGFTSLGCRGGAVGQYMAECIFYRVATATGETPPSISWTAPGAGHRGHQVLASVYGNVNTTTPIGTVGAWVASDPANATSVTAASLTPSETGSQIVFVGVSYQTADGPYTLTSTTGFANWSDNLRMFGSSISSEIYLSDATSTGAATGTAQFTMVTADNLAAVMFELNHK